MMMMMMMMMMILDRRRNLVQSVSGTDLHSAILQKLLLGEQELYPLTCLPHAAPKGVLGPMNFSNWDAEHLRDQVKSPVGDRQLIVVQKLLAQFHLA